MAVGREQLGEDAADNGPEEGKTGADDGDVTFCSCPVGSSNVTVFGVVSTIIKRTELGEAYKMCLCSGRQAEDWRDEGYS